VLLGEHRAGLQPDAGADRDVDHTVFGSSPNWAAMRFLGVESLAVGD
jgi:hypothetical protein